MQFSGRFDILPMTWSNRVSTFLCPSVSIVVFGWASLCLLARMPDSMANAIAYIDQLLM